jgi:hypothetical protein
MESEPMMQVVNQYTFAPGQCRICGGAKVPAIDTGLEMDGQGFDGRLYFCHDCVTSMYSMISGTLGSPGMVPSHRFAELQGRAELAEQQARDYREALDAVRGDTPIGQEFRRVADILSRMADSEDAGPDPAEEPATPSSTAAPDLASLPPHPSDEELEAAKANTSVPEVPSAEEQAALAAAHREADRAQRGDQRVDPGADLAVAPPVATAIDPNDPEAARLRDDQTARFEDQQARADKAQAELDAVQRQVIDDEAARQSPAGPPVDEGTVPADVAVDPTDGRVGTPVSSPADDAVVPSSIQPPDVLGGGAVPPPEPTMPASPADLARVPVPPLPGAFAGGVNADNADAKQVDPGEPAETVDEAPEPELKRLTPDEAAALNESMTADEPATVPTGDADPGETVPFPAPAADSVEPADEAPPVPADDDATPAPVSDGTDESSPAEVAADDPAAPGEEPAPAAPTTKRSRRATS